MLLAVQHDLLELQAWRAPVIWRATLVKSDPESFVGVCALSMLKILDHNCPCGTVDAA